MMAYFDHDFFNFYLMFFFLNFQSTLVKTRKRCKNKRVWIIMCTKDKKEKRQHSSRVTSFCLL